jgi:hypothetical protein
MRKLKVLSAVLAVTVFGAIATPILAQKERTKTFVEMATEMPDGKLPKERVMAMLDKTFDKADTRNEKKIDAQQARQFQQFLREFTRESGG